MRIDAHQHFWQYNAERDAWIDNSMFMLRKDYMPNNLELLLQENKIDGCVAVQASTSEEETEFLLKLAEDHNFIKGVVGWLDLCDPNIEKRLKHFSKNPKLKGLRHIVQVEPPGFMLRADFQKGISLLEKFNLTYDILIYPYQLEETIALVSKFPKQKFILDHCAKPYIKEGKIDTWKFYIDSLSKFKNVACKISGLATEADWNSWNLSEIKPYLDVVINSFGSNRLMLGSDWPVCLLAGNYKDALSIVEDHIEDFSKINQEKIMGLTALEWYNLID
jgi:L-fuconolactonase